MSDETKHTESRAELLKIVQCVYLAVDEKVADDISTRLQRHITLHDELVAENATLKAKCKQTYCAYCGFEVAIDDEAASKVSAHIASCPKHPMREVEKLTDELVAMLESIEWVQWEFRQNQVVEVCPNCLCRKRIGHADDCKLADVLKRAKGD